MPQISPRLLLCAELVAGDFACDIGTDHALLPVYLVGNNICRKALACDIADGPLEAASKTISQNGMQDKIITIKSDGLSNVPSENITDVIIAGMGGETICDILASPKAQWVKNNVNLILQPMTRADVLRKWLSANGFCIHSEKTVCEGKFIYSVMCVRYCGISVPLTELSALLGKINVHSDSGREYALFQQKRIEKVANGLFCSGNTENADKLNKISQKILRKLGNKKMTISEIYDIINTFAPFKTQEGFDNSGLLVGTGTAEVTKILLSLDITADTVDEAKELGAELIVSHHPVIFSPIKQLDAQSIPYKLANNSIAAICSHTPLDMAQGGVNDAIFDLLNAHIGIEEKCGIFAEISNGIGYGSVCTLKEETNADTLAGILKNAFDCKVVRFYDNGRKIKKIAYCSGSGSSFFDVAEAKGVDALITGDIKHNVWIDAKNSGICLFDCGHYHTERIILPVLKQLIENNTTDIEVIISRHDKDIVQYCF